MLQLTYADYFRDPGLPVCLVATNRRNSSFPEHHHEFYELVIVRNGSGTHLLNGVGMQARSGDVFVIPPGVTHAYPGRNTLELANILFDPVRLRLAEDDLATIPGYNVLFTIEPHYRPVHKLESCLRMDAGMLLQVDREILRLRQEAEQKNPGYRTSCTAIFKGLLVLLCRGHTGKRTPEHTMALRLAEAVSVLEQSFQKNVAIDDLAEIAHISRSVFYRTFKAVYGKTPLAYRIDLRMQCAARLLRDTALPITQIALESGMADGNYFSRTFHVAYGMSPTDYRKRREV